MTYCILGMIVCILFCYLGYRIEHKKIINPASLFFAEWGVILLFSSLQLWTLYLPDDNIYAMILIGLCSFFVGYLFYKTFLKKKNLRLRQRSGNSAVTFVARYKLLYGLALLSIIYYFLWSYNVLKQISSVNLMNIISSQRSGEFIGYENKIMNALSIFIFRPFAIAFPAIAAVDFWFGKRDRVLFSLNILLIIVGLFSSGGRTTVLTFGIYFITCAMVYLKRNNMKLFPRKKISKTKRRVRLIIIAVGVIFIIMTISRGFVGSAILQNIYIAFAIQPRMFEIWGDYVVKNHIVGLGCTSLFGFIYPFFYLIKNIFGLPLPGIVEELFDCIGLTETQWVWPGTGMRNNAYVSAFWYFFTDARLIGIIIGMFLWGIYSAKRQYSVTQVKFNERNMAMYCLCLYLTLFSFVRFQFGTYQFALATIYVSFIAYRKKGISIGKSEDN